MKPSIGSIVHVKLRARRANLPGGPVVEPAIVTWVHDATTVNVRLLGESRETPLVRERLTLADHEELDASSWAWPPRV